MLLKLLPAGKLPTYGRRLCDVWDGEREGERDRVGELYSLIREAGLGCLELAGSAWFVCAGVGWVVFLEVGGDVGISEVVFFTGKLRTDANSMHSQVWNSH